MWISGLLVVGSLLAVVVGDAFITQGQVRLSSTERALASAEADQKTLQLAVAGKAAPPVVVSQAKRQGLVAASQVVSLPQVPLGVPLPPPHIVRSTGAAASSTPPPANSTPSKPVAPTPSSAATTPATAPATTASPAPATTATTAAAPR